MNRFAVALILLPLFSGVTFATQLGRDALIRWKIMDACAKQAQMAYPDHSAEANAKRDAKLQECLNTLDLPPREPLAKPQSPTNP